MFQAFGSPPRPTRTVDARRAKSSFSPYSSKPVEKKPTAKFYELDDDESEDDLGSFISVIDSSRRRAVVNVSYALEGEIQWCLLFFLYIITRIHQEMFYRNAHCAI